MYVAKSTDGGKNWITPIVNANPQMDSVDNPDAKADLSGTYPKNIYVTWTGVNFDKIEFAESTDDGLTFQQTPTNLESSTNTQPVRGSNIAIAPDGTIYVFWAIGDDPETAIRFCKISGGGSTINAAQTAFSITGLKVNQPDPYFNGVRVNSWPSAGIDRTNDGPRRGWIYVVYAEKSSTGDSDIHLMRSTDDGSSWNGPYLVNQTAADKKEQWFPSLSVDQVSGDLFVLTDIKLRAVILLISMQAISLVEYTFTNYMREVLLQLRNCFC